jgi:hypothetical protein
LMEISKELGIFIDISKSKVVINGHWKDDKRKRERGKKDERKRKKVKLPRPINLYFSQRQLPRFSVPPNFIIRQNVLLSKQHIFIANRYTNITSTKVHNL